MKCLGCNKKCICKKCINDLCGGSCIERKNINYEESYWIRLTTLSTLDRVISEEGSYSCSGFEDWITKMTKIGYIKGERNGIV